MFFENKYENGCETKNVHILEEFAEFIKCKLVIIAKNIEI